MVGRGVPAGSVPCATPPDRPRTRHGHPSAPRFSTSAAPSRRREKEPRRPVATRRDPQLAEIAAGRRRESARSCSSSTRPRSPARPRLEDTRRSVVWPSRERGRRRRRRLHGRPRPTCHRPAPARARRGSAGRGAQGSERRAAEASTRRRVGRRSVARDGWMVDHGLPPLEVGRRTDARSVRPAPPQATLEAGRWARIGTHWNALGRSPERVERRTITAPGTTYECHSKGNRRPPK